MNITTYTRITNNLFETVYNALLAYTQFREDDPEQKSYLHTRFCAMWDMIEAANLVDEYEGWKEENV